jgi:hypothetical protein
MDFLVETGTLRRFSTGNPDDLGGNRVIGGVPAIAGKYPDGWFAIAWTFSDIRNSSLIGFRSRAASTTRLHR